MKQSEHFGDCEQLEDSPCLPFSSIRNEPTPPWPVHYGSMKRPGENIIAEYLKTLDRDTDLTRLLERPR